MNLNIHNHLSHMSQEFLITTILVAPPYHSLVIISCPSYRHHHQSFAYLCLQSRFHFPVMFLTIFFFFLFPLALILFGQVHRYHQYATQHPDALITLHRTRTVDATDENKKLLPHESRKNDTKLTTFEKLTPRTASSKKIV